MENVIGKTKNSLKRLRVYFRDDKKPSIIEWIIIGLITAIIFFSFIYADLYAVTIWSVSAWDALFDGRFFEYYKYCVDNIYGLNNQYNGGDLLVTLILAVWNFPLYLAKQFFGVNIIYSVPALLWAKSFYLVLQAVSMYLVFKIAIKLGLSKTNAKWAVFAFCASSSLLFGAYIDCQTDILCMPFYLLAFLFLLNNKKSLFALLIAISVAIKPYPIIIFFPLLLATEKRLSRIIIYSIEALSIIFIMKYLSNGLPYYEISTKSLSDLYIKNFLAGNISIGIGQVALFPLSYALLCVYAYLHNFENEQYKNRLLLFFAFSSLAVYFAFAIIEYYRILLLAPFIALLCLQNVRHNKALSISLIIFIFSFLIIGAYTQPLVFEIYTESTLERMLLSKIFGSTRFLTREYLSSAGVIDEHLKVYENGIRSLYIASIVSAMYLSHPKQYLDKANLLVNKELVWLQLAPIIIIVIVACNAYFSVI